ncbi:uncharacterized protein L201_005847 [Kwoniella dendrophila CBS 6074]|uniref:Uncharacterized protein n=1 Tax=Kwoniella dendrophila CBS 6074 TaxID=1295534 RepID=A0AAX4K1B1_9TREE
MSLPIHEEETAIPLLETSGYPSNRQQQNRDHGKHTKWFKFNFRLVFNIILGLISLVILISISIGSVVGYKKYHKLVFPHRKVHANKASLKDGSKFDLVKPFFSNTNSKNGDDGGLPEGDLIIKLWFREGILLEWSNPNKVKPEFYDNYDMSIYRQWYEENDLIRSSGEQGYIKLPEKSDPETVTEEFQKQNDWKEIWSMTLSNLDIEQKNNVKAKVNLPGEIVHSLVNNNRSHVVATFEIVPSNRVIIDKSLTYNHKSTRPTESYGSSKSYPLSYSSDDSRPKELQDFLSHSGVGQNVHERIRIWSSNAYYDTENGITEQVFSNYILKKTWITMAKDYSIYGLNDFQNAMNALRDFKQQCAKSRWTSPDCYRIFSHDGHFENLLETQNEKGEKEYKYGPFLTTRLTPGVVQDYIKLPSKEQIKDKKPNEISDFNFDWDITYLSLSPAKLSLAPINSMYGPNIWNDDDEDVKDSHSAVEYDTQEFNSALLGLSFNPESRPIARGIIHTLSVLLRYIAAPFIFHYWITRKTSTGITILTTILQTIVDLICYIVILALNFEFVYIFLFVITIICFVLIVLKQIWLFLKPEFMIEKMNSQYSIPVPVPVAIRFKENSVLEKNSYKEDKKFDCKLRILITLLTFSIFRFAPIPPSIIAGTKFRDIMHGFGGATHYDPTVLNVIHLFKSVQSSFWLITQSSQIILNYRQKSFAGSHIITSYLLFTSLFLSHLTKIFTGWFGKPQLIQPFSVWDLISLIISAGIVVQAILYKSVNQVEDDLVD